MSLFQIANTAVTTGSWTQVSGVNAKQLLLRMRDASEFKVSDTSTGTNYFTVTGALSLNFEDTYENSTPCDVYVQATVNGTLEVLYAR